MNSDVTQGRSAPRTTDDIVVGVDGSVASAAALTWAAAQSEATGRPLHVVHSWQLRAAQVEGAGDAFRATAIADARARATRWVLAALGTDTTTHWTLTLVEGPPGPALVAQSRTASLLVVGTGEHNGLRRVPRGSVSRYALSHAVPPVVAVHALAS